MVCPMRSLRKATMVLSWYSADNKVWIEAIRINFLLW